MLENKQIYDLKMVLLMKAYQLVKLIILNTNLKII